MNHVEGLNLGSVPRTDGAMMRQLCVQLSLHLRVVRSARRGPELQGGLEAPGTQLKRQTAATAVQGLVLKHSTGRQFALEVGQNACLVVDMDDRAP